MIPKNIFQTYYKQPTDKDLIIAQNSFKRLNFNYYFYDDEEGYKFLKENFVDDVWKAYNVLKPGAYKADLLRMCLLYKYGGIYADIKIVCKKFPFELMEEDLVLVNDVPKNYIWNGFIMSKKKHPYLKLIIQNIAKNVKKLYYGNNTLCITGPYLCGKLYFKYFNKGENILYHQKKLHLNGREFFIKDKKNQILLIYNKKLIQRQEYDVLWKSKNVYDLELYKKYF